MVSSAEKAGDRGDLAPVDLVAARMPVRPDLAPWARNQASSARVASGGQIGSRSPAVISTRVVTGAGAGAQGIRGCISTARPNRPGRAKITLARMLAPFE